MLRLILVLVLMTTGCASEEDAWNDACSRNDGDAYRKFLTEYPETSYALRARTRMAEILYADGDLTAAMDAYQEVLGYHPVGDHVQATSQRIEDIAFAVAEATDSVDSWEAFLEHHAGGRHAAAASEALLNLRNEIRWRRAPSRTRPWELTPEEFLPHVGAGRVGDFGDWATFYCLRELGPSGCAGAVIYVPGSPEASSLSRCVFSELSDVTTRERLSKAHDETLDSLRKACNPGKVLVICSITSELDG